MLESQYDQMLREYLAPYQIDINRVASRMLEQQLTMGQSVVQIGDQMDADQQPRRYLSVRDALTEPFRPAEASHPEHRDGVNYPCVRVVQHFKNRRGWKRSVQESGTHYVSSRIVMPEHWNEGGIQRIDFELVKESVTDNHRTRERVREAWYEEI